MATAITASDVTNDYSTSISNTEINLLITFVDQADTCLDAKAVASDIQHALKVLAVRHMLALMENDGRGKATSEQAPSGAGRSFQHWQGKDIQSTRYGSMVKQMDRYGCVSSLLENTQKLALRSIGRRHDDDTRPTYGD